MTRGLCGREWSAAHPGGTNDDFNAYFKELTKGALKVCSLYRCSVSCTQLLL